MNVGELSCEVIELIRGTTHDGPGMRTTVFLKGCPLHCRWCQNPEGIQAGKEIWWEERKCIHCLSCVEACPERGIGEEQGRLRTNRQSCTLCGECVEACPAKAMTFTSQEWSVSDLLKTVLKDREFFAAFGGGVTVSGGEPLRHYRFVAEFFQSLQQQGVHTALDTCGFAPRAALEGVLPFTDQVLFDIKLLDPHLHQQYTGQSNARILENLATVAGYVRASRQDRPAAMKLWIRTPLIPGSTATGENIAAIARYLRANLADVLERWELCAFNPACRSKYQKLGIPWAYEDGELLGQGLIDSLKSAALSEGIAADRLVVSGLVAAV